METVLAVSLGFSLVCFLALVAIVLWAALESKREVIKFARDVVETKKADSLEDKVDADHKRATFELNKQQMLDALSLEIERAKSAEKEKKKSERVSLVKAENGRHYDPLQLEEVGPNEV